MGATSTATTRILVVDDDQGIREALGRSLPKLGFHVSLANGGEEGLRLAAAEHPDLILLDLHMPGLDGRKFLERLSGAAAGAAVLLVSGEAPVHEVIEAHLLGGGEFLAKPWSNSELASAIRRSLELRARYVRPQEASDASA